MAILVTGTAGFIGNHIALHYLNAGETVIGVDNLNTYYDVELKKARLARISSFKNFIDYRVNLHDRDQMMQIFADHKPTRVFHMGAQAGVRYSVVDPYSYVDSNLLGFTNILEGCRHHGCEHLLYASSSSVYGANTEMPYSPHDHCEHPMSFYAATKKANELMAHNYSHIFKIPMTGLRFFTVYGPWGRPDMALHIFSKAILSGEPIDVFNNGAMKRAFTYIDDVVESIVRLAEIAPTQTAVEKGAASLDPASSPVAPYRIVNIGNDVCVDLGRYIDVLEEKLGKKAVRNMKPVHPGDVLATWADIDELKALINFAPTISIEDGVGRFVKWYLDYYGHNAD